MGHDGKSRGARKGLLEGSRGFNHQGWSKWGCVLFENHVQPFKKRYLSPLERYLMEVKVGILVF
jgi:hypothetical protein